MNTEFLTSEQKKEIMDLMTDGMSQEEAYKQVVGDGIPQEEKKFACKDCGKLIDTFQSTETFGHTGKPLCKEHYAVWLKATGYDPIKPGLVPDDFEATEEVDNQSVEEQSVSDVPETALVKPNNKPATPAQYTAGIDAQVIPYFSEDQIDTIKNTVAKGANNDELAMFLHLCNTYGLDPFLKEIYYSSDMKTILTSRDGYLKIAQRHPEYEGMQSMAVCENDDFELDVQNHTVKHKFGKGDRGPVIGAWAIVYRINRKPMIAYADYNEYKRSSGPWTKYKSAMCCKVAESFALKRQFGISGLVTQEEMGANA